MEFFLQIALILACLFYGARRGGLALGLPGGLACWCSSRRRGLV